MPAIERVDVRVCRLATEPGPLSDGTATWDATTMVIVEPAAAGVVGLGYSYIDGAAAAVVRNLLTPAILGVDAFALPTAMAAMLRAVRNHGRPGLVACAISAVDVALWDLKAKLLDVSLAALGPGIELMVDANGAYAPKPALSMAERFASHGVVYFEEPVSSDDLEGLRLVRDRAPAGMAPRSLLA